MATNAALVIDRPFPQLALNIPLVDVDAFANRDIATRRAEVVLPRTQAKKWLNHFQLYLKAMRPRATFVASTTDQGTVVALVRDSWKLEPVNIKQYYVGLSVFEKSNHNLAHPKPVSVPIVYPPMPDITVDVGAFVNRDIAVRRAEKIGPQKLPPKKPQNSFILYKKAYKDCLNLLCLGPHQTSKNKAWAKSWEMETKEVKDQYNGYMAAEKAGFLKAFPDAMSGEKYTGNLSIKRKADKMESEEAPEQDIKKEAK